MLQASKFNASLQVWLVLGLAKTIALESFQIRIGVL